MMKLSSRIPVFVLRLLALSASVSATVVMVTNYDSTNVLGINFEAKYTNSPTFKYFVGVNSIASGYTLIALFFPTKTPWTNLILFLDLMVALLLDSGLSASLAIGQVGKSGDKHAGWLPVCGQVPKFCDHAAGALIANFVAAVAYVLILLYSVHNVKNLCNSS